MREPKGKYVPGSTPVARHRSLPKIHSQSNAFKDSKKIMADTKRSKNSKLNMSVEGSLRGLNNLSPISRNSDHSFSLMELSQ